MRREYCRYTPAQMRSLGYVPTYANDFINIDPLPAKSIEDISRGQIGNIIDVLYSSEDGSLDNNLQSLVSENAPESVRSFVNNVLLCDIQAFKAAPDDETAFSCLIPRKACTPSELRPYLDDIQSFISQHRQSSQPASNK